MLNGEMNPIDECTACMMEIININDVENVNVTLESISQIHSDKLKFGKVKASFLNLDHSDADLYFDEQQKAFLSLFKSSLKTKDDFGMKKGDIDDEELPKNSLCDAQ